LRTAQLSQIVIEAGRFEREQSELASASRRRDSCGEFFFGEFIYCSESGFGWTFNRRAGE
jgi:hypothetical protein